jgi:outer membrane cobalamin receptor
LRGTGSLALSLMPSIFIDGVVVSNPEEGLDVLSRIPASDVLDIEVLRGPAAAFRYPFAANGVVLVRTRLGAGR